MVRVAIKGPKAGDAVRALKRELMADLQAAERKTTDQLRTIVRTLSSGTVSERLLSTSVMEGGYGHPYGHGSFGSLGPRGPIPYGDAAVINAQTGQFRAGWQSFYGSWAGSTLVNKVVNNSDHARKLEALPDAVQIARPIMARAAERIAPIRIANIRAVLDKYEKL